MFLTQPGPQLAIRTWLSIAGCLAACSLQMPSESEVFGSAGGKPDASGGAAGRANPLGDSGSEDTGGAGSFAGSGGVVNPGTSGASGAAGKSGALGESGAAGASGATSTFDPAAGLVAYFAFDDANGAVVSNAKDSKKGGKCVGTCTRSNGQLGLAFALRNNLGPTDWVELPAGIFDGHAAITLSIWLRDLSTSRNGAPLFYFSASANEAIYFIPDDKSGSSAGAHLGGVHKGASFVNLWSARPNLADKDWHQLAFSWDSASIEFYLDGKSVGSASKPSALPSQLGATSPDYLGRTPDDNHPALFGEFDDLRVYDRVLTATQVALLYKVR